MRVLSRPAYASRATSVVAAVIANGRVALVGATNGIRSSVLAYEAPLLLKVPENGRSMSLKHRGLQVTSRLGWTMTEQPTTRSSWTNYVRHVRHVRHGFLFVTISFHNPTSFLCAQRLVFYAHRQIRPITSSLRKPEGIGLETRPP